MPVYTFRIQRNWQTEQGTRSSHYRDYSLEVGPTTTVLTALEEIKASQDGTLTFRQSCRSAICGSCAMKINGRTRLACKTHVGAVAKDGVLEIGPMANQPVIKDLVVDIAPFYRKIHQIKPYLEEGPETDQTLDKSAYDHVNEVTQCIMCGSCYSDCTMAEVSEAFIGPAALAKAFRFVSDPREGQKTARLEALSAPSMMWSCTRCVQCVESCPKDVKPMEAIVKLRTRGMNSGFVQSAAVRHALAFHEDILNRGTLNEFTLLQRTAGVMGIIGELDMVWHLLKKGKIPSPLPHAIQGVEELRKIYLLLEESPIDVETKAKEIVPE
ncbi:MAG: succinate dehydrogenase iron-sulfur subunit [Magnetococcus sp. XQGC-1]